MGGKNRDYSPLNIPGESSMGNHSPSVNESFDFNKKENINRALFPNIKSSLSKIQITEMENGINSENNRGVVPYASPIASLNNKNLKVPEIHKRERG